MCGVFQGKFLVNRMLRNFLKNVFSRSLPRFRSSTVSKGTQALQVASPIVGSRAMATQALRVQSLRTLGWVSTFQSQ